MSFISDITAAATRLIYNTTFTKFLVRDIGTKIEVMLTKYKP